MRGRPLLLVAAVPLFLALSLSAVAVVAAPAQANP